MRAERDESSVEVAVPAPPRRRRGRFLLLLVLALVVVAGGAWTWMVYGKRLSSMIAGSSAGGGVPVVRADPTPTKVRPSDPGGMDVPDRDKLVYERLRGDGAEKRVERLMAPPEAPITPPRAAESRPTQRPAPEAMERLPRVPTEAQVRAAVKPAPPPLTPRASAPEPEDSPPSSVDTAPEAPTPEAVAEAKPEPKAETRAEPKPEPKSEPARVAQPAPPASASEQTQKSSASEQAPAPASGYLIQIAAVREPERAETEWSRLQRQHGETLRGLKLYVVRADLGDKGVFWRLRAGPFSDEAAAKNRCAELAKRKVGCMVVKAQG